jgi:hypothetical protein
MSEDGQRALAKLETHEAVCAERYKALDIRLAMGANRMQRIEYILYGVVALIVFGEGTVLQFVSRVFLNKAGA